VPGPRAAPLAMRAERARVGDGATSLACRLRPAAARAAAQALCLAAAGGLFGCGLFDASTFVPVTLTLAGTVSDDAGGPVEGATVEARPYDIAAPGDAPKDAPGSVSATTDRDGGYEIRGLATGNHEVSAHGIGYAGAEPTTTVVKPGPRPWT
jgi:hypothetical protein